MSGAEAIFGVVSGGAGLASLAIQLGDCAVKLKRVYYAAKSAPRTIERLIFGLETMAMALSELEQHRQRHIHDGALLFRCITECQHSTTDIQRLVDKMERYMTSYGKVGRMYTVFHERDVKELLDELERAKSSLELAYMMYLAAEQRRREQEHGILLNDLQA